MQVYFNLGSPISRDIEEPALIWKHALEGTAMVRSGTKVGFNDFVTGVIVTKLEIVICDSILGISEILRISFAYRTKA